MDKIITIGGIKGGIGKSLVACQLASRIAQDKRNRPLLLDADEQRTSSTFHQFRQEQNVPQFDCKKAYGLDLIKTIQSIEKDYNIIVVDVSGKDTQSQRASISISSILLLPFPPSSFDLWTCSQVQELALEAKKVNKKLKAFSFLNKAETRKTSKDNATALEYLRTLKGIKCLELFVSNRKAYKNASSLGLCVNELKSSLKNPNANDEIEQLYNNIIKTLS